MPFKAYNVKMNGFIGTVREFSNRFYSSLPSSITPIVCSYMDVVNRLDPVVVALEKQDGPVVIISHQVSCVMLRQDNKYETRDILAKSLINRYRNGINQALEISVQ